VKADQSSVQESDCQRPEDCQQANQAKQTRGKGNDATGFNDDGDNLPQSECSSALFSPPSPVALETNSPDNRSVNVTIPVEGVCSGGSIKIAVSATGLPAFLRMGVQGASPNIGRGSVRRIRPIMPHRVLPFHHPHRLKRWIWVPRYLSRLE
jgi:hypothetical protein